MKAATIDASTSRSDFARKPGLRTPRASRKVRNQLARWHQQYCQWRTCLDNLASIEADLAETLPLNQPVPGMKDCTVIMAAFDLNDAPNDLASFLAGVEVATGIRVR